MKLKSKDMQKMYLLIIVIIFIIDKVEPKACGFSNHAELHYRKHHRVITNESKPYLHFTYEDKNDDGPSHWPSSCNSGQFQSPIAYDSVHPIADSRQNPLKLIGAYNTLPKEVNVINSGHGETFSFLDSLACYTSRSVFLYHSEINLLLVIFEYEGG